MKFKKHILRTHRAHKFWLKLTAISFCCIGFIIFLGSSGNMFLPNDIILNILDLILFDKEFFHHSNNRIFYAMNGGLLMGWGITILLLSIRVYDKAPEDVRKVFLAGLLSWFILHSAGSLSNGNGTSLIFNIVFLFVAVGPLWQVADYNFDI